MKNYLSFCYEKIFSIIIIINYHCKYYMGKNILNNLMKYSRPNYDEAILVITRTYYVNEPENYNI